MDNRFDVIIPVAGKDVYFVHKITKKIRKFIPEALTIYVITKNQNINRITKSVKDQSNIIILDEDKLVQGLYFEKLKTFVQDNTKCTSIGWYYQQFLKLGFALSEYSKDYYLSWDADTIPVSEIKFFSEGKPLFTQKNEYNENYFFTLKKILGLEKTNSYSFIAEHMLFKTSIVKTLLNDIEQNNPNGLKWFETILLSCNYDHSLPGFSEFETYGTYVSKYFPDLYKTRSLRTFRHGGLIRGRFISEKILDKLTDDLDIISIELYDQPPFPYNIPNRWWRFKELLYKATHNNPKLVFQKSLKFIRNE